MLGGDTVIFLQDEVNWEVGQEILLVTSSWFDCPPELESEWCIPCTPEDYDCMAPSYPHQNEIKTILAIDTQRFRMYVYFKVYKS